MADLTPDRLAELRRIAEAATPGPWAWRMSKDGRILDLITLETGYNEEIITPSHINAWLQVKGGLKDFVPAFDPATALALLDRVEQLEADNNKLERENGELYRRIERLEGKLARQRVMLTRLQAAIERRATGDWVEATRRAMADEVVERHVREADVALDEAERWRQKYEALRAGAEHVLQLIAREERNEGFLEPDLEEIRRMLTAALAEAGGGSQ